MHPEDGSNTNVTRNKQEPRAFSSYVPESTCAKSRTLSKIYKWCQPNLLMWPVVRIAPASTHQW